jgi:hypothetical protein
MGRVVFDRSGIGAGSVPDIAFIAPPTPWTIGWSNNCPKNYPESARSMSIMGVATVGNHTTEWYRTHVKQMWDEQLADPGQSLGHGSVTVNDHSGQTYLELNTVCAWHVVIRSGVEQFAPSLASTASLAPQPANDGDDS